MRILGDQEVKADAIVDARKREALSTLALHATPYMAHKKLWDQLDLSYFMRHDGDDIAWHTRHLSKALALPSSDMSQSCLVRARRSQVNDGLQVMVFAPDQTDLFARICGYFDKTGFSILDARIHNTKSGNALDTFQVTSPHVAEQHREYVGMIEAELSALINKKSTLPQAHMGRLSRRVKSFPMPARVDLRPDDKAQHWLLTISASDRTGLLYGVARTLALHSVSVELSKITTLGERVEDTFLVSGEALLSQKSRIALETELLDVLNESPT
jgi:[protein-PII] uridylyltransferase